MHGIFCCSHEITLACPGAHGGLAALIKFQRWAQQCPILCPCGWVGCPISDESYCLVQHWLSGALCQPQPCTASCPLKACAQVQSL